MFSRVGSSLLITADMAVRSSWQLLQHLLGFPLLVAVAQLDKGVGDLVHVVMNGDELPGRGVPGPKPV